MSIPSFPAELLIHGSVMEPGACCIRDIMEAFQLRKTCLHHDSDQPSTPGGKKSAASREKRLAMYTSFRSLDCPQRPHSAVGR